MAEPSTPLSHALLVPRGRQVRSTSDSPTRQRGTDDLLSNLTPRNAVEAFRNPAGSLKECMDAATPAEQAFAMRAAIASKSIQEWLDELSAWPWPSGGGSVGFEMPATKRRRLSRSDGELLHPTPLAVDDRSPVDKAYCGSLLATDVARYERRVAEISRNMEDLDVEEIKTQVLHNHIMPLSRPGSPMLDSGRSVASSLSAYARMDDLTALMTATLIQALPNLSRLTRLMNVWSLRLLVLRKIPVFLTSLADGEIALQSGWNAINSSPRADPDDGSPSSPRSAGPSTLSRKEFDVMKSILERKVAKTGRDLDAMLDVLEGCEDTLPEHWIDRVDALERQYGEWTVACEQKIREADWARAVREITAAAPAVVVRPEAKLDEKSVEKSEKELEERPEEKQEEKQEGRPEVKPEVKQEEKQEKPEGKPEEKQEINSVEKLEDEPLEKPKQKLEGRPGQRGINGCAALEGATHAGHSLASTSPSPEEGTVSPTETEGSSLETEHSSGNGDFSQNASEPSEQLTSLDTSLRLREESPTPVIKVHQPPEEPIAAESLSQNGKLEDGEVDPVDDGERGIETDEDVIDAFDGAQTDEARANGKSPEEIGDDVEPWPIFSESIQKHLGEVSQDGARSDEADVDSDFEDISEVDVPQPDLPTLPRPRRDSDMSNTSTVVHGLQSGFADFSSDQLEHGTPELSRLRDLDLEAIPSDGLSPGSSPQAFRSSTRSLSVSFNDMPTVTELPDDEASPRTPSKSSFIMDDDLPKSIIGSPSKMSVTSATSADDQLQQQISEILESVPAKIRLTSEPAAINLNPPDFTMPTRKASKPDSHPRSHSSLSTVSNMSSRAGTPSFTLAPAYNRNSRTRHQRGGGNQEIKLYHLSRSNGEAPIKLFIRCVGEHGERVMVRVGGGWADLGEYLKEYASHHGRRSGGQGKVEIKDLHLPSLATGRAASTPPTRPASAQESYSPITPLNVRKTRKTAAVEEEPSSEGGAAAPAPQQQQPKTPLTTVTKPDTPSSGADSTRSRSSSRLSWTEEDSSLGMAGPRAKQIEMSEESKAWVESVKEKVRIASGERKVSEPVAAAAGASSLEGKFGEMGKVGATKRLFRRQG